jgi:hypothetical protein
LGAKVIFHKTLVIISSIQSWYTQSYDLQSYVCHKNDSHDDDGGKGDDDHDDNNDYNDYASQIMFIGTPTLAETL